MNNDIMQSKAFVPRPPSGLALVGLGALAGAVAGRLAARQPEPGRIPWLATWEAGLAETQGKMTAALLAARVQARYSELYTGRPRFAHPVLRVHLERFILPGLALYQILREHEHDQAAALAEVERLFVPSFGHKRDWFALLRPLRRPFPLLRRVLHAGMRVGFPPEGWEVEWLENSDRAYAFNIRRCFYLQMFTYYGAPELTAAFCKNDDIRFGQMPPSITWSRTQTLGRGGAMCDFRWCPALSAQGDQANNEALTPS